MPEKAKRLQPKSDTLRELFLKSGNLCAFPDCANLIMNASAVFIGEVCHIEAAEEGGQRFNPAMTNEERRAAANLMLMCHEHHKVTDDVTKFPVAKLRQVKEDHESRFANPDRAILEKLTDWTTREAPTGVTNLKRMNAVLGWDEDDEHLQSSVATLNAYIDVLRRVPVGVRRFLSAVVARAHRMRDTRAVRCAASGSTLILAGDIEEALQLSPAAITERVSQLESYGLGDFDEMDTDSGAQVGVRIRALKSGWAFWRELAAFCEKSAIHLEVFTVDLDFARLDEP